MCSTSATSLALRLLITAAGIGWAFALNAVSYAAPLTALAFIKPHRSPNSAITAPAPGRLLTLIRRSEIWRPIILGSTFGMFTFNLPVTLATYARTADTGPAGYALLTSAVALGSVLGGLVSAGRGPATPDGLTRTGYFLALMYGVAAAMPAPWSLGCSLVGIGIVATLLFTATNAAVQLAAGAAHRGRVIGVYLLVETGSAAVGGLLLGVLNEHLGPRIGLALAGVVPATTITLLSLALLANRRFGYHRAAQAPSHPNPDDADDQDPTPPLSPSSRTSRPTTKESPPPEQSERDRHPRPTSGPPLVSTHAVKPAASQRDKRLSPPGRRSNSSTLSDPNRTESR
ncbi:MFS transporter [Nocardia sp. NPDC059239]|uniref:MFS transporter n=1 Tax=Nocardia sp. NPDC059239 TaxID=3346785 RepID=UPI00367D7973